MADFKGSILELNAKHAIVMTENCEFISIKRTPEMFVGQQLNFSKDLSKLRIKSQIKYAASIAAVLIMVLFSITYFRLLSPSPIFAYIDIDINPSLEFTIDETLKVIDVSPLNSDAQKVIDQLTLKRKPVKEAILEVIVTSKQLGYINSTKSNEVLVSASLKADDNKELNNAEEALSAALSDINDLSVEVGSKNLKPQIIRVTPEVRKAAAENKISMGRYELYNKIKKQGSELTIEKAKNERVSDMLKKAEPGVEKIENNNTPKRANADGPPVSQKNPEKKDKKKENQNPKHSSPSPATNQKSGENFKSQGTDNEIMNKDDKTKNKDNKSEKAPPSNRTNADKPNSEALDNKDEKGSLNDEKKSPPGNKESQDKNGHGPKDKEPPLKAKGKNDK